MRNRWDIIIDLINKNNYQFIVEVGVYCGQTAIPVLNNCPGIKKYWAIDLNILQCIIDAMRSKPIFPLQMDSIIASKIFSDKSLDLVFIDANHSYDSVNSEIKAYLPKIRSGGIMAGHDFCVLHQDVIKAVKENFKEDEYHLEQDFAITDVLDEVWWVNIK